MKNIFIRADANEIIATGHIMRTSAVAYALKNLGVNPIFITADNKAKLFLNGYENIILNSAYNDLNAELDALCQLLGKNKNSVLLIDSYFINPFYLSELLKFTKLAYIDDLCAFAYEVDLLINYSAFLDFEAYKSKQNKAKNYLLGSNYAPLRAEFKIQASKSPKNTELKKILITTGGGDKINLTYNLLNALTKDKDLMRLEYEIIIGAYNKYKEQILNLGKKYINFKTHENVKNMAGLMQEADVIMCAGGSTLYELAALAKPCICFKIASNQQDAIKWAQAKALLYAGDGQNQMNESINLAINYLKFLLKNPDEAQKIATNASKLVDGNGAKKIAKALIEL